MQSHSEPKERSERVSRAETTLVLDLWAAGSGVRLPTPRTASMPEGSMSEGRPAGRQGSPVKRKSIEFRELLERLLPLDSLPPASRLEVQRALHSGVTAQIERAALIALRDLERQGTLRRLPSRDNGQGPALRYERRDSFDIITVQLPEPP